MSVIAPMSAVGAILAAHDRSIETVVCECTKCGARKKVRCGHALSDLQIKRRHFRTWQVRGVQGAKKTLCGRCKA